MKRIIAALIILAALIAGLALPVHATAISQPDTLPSFTDIHVNTYVVESGDMCITGIYNIPYATLPTTVDANWTADKTFVFRLMDTDNTTELGAITPYAYFDSGYNYGVFSFYFPQTSAPSWGQAYTIRVSENPAIFASPVSWDSIIPLPSYTSVTSQADNQADLADHVANYAHTLEAQYPTYTLITTSGGRAILTSTGENYFRGAIYGLQAMAPSLYFLQESPIDYTANTWTTTQFDTYAAKYNTSWIGAAENATAAQFNVSTSVAVSPIVLILCFAFCAFCSILMKKMEPGWLIACVLLMWAVLQGWVAAALFAIIYQLMAFYIAYIWFFAKGRTYEGLALMWIISTLICLALEGGYFGETHNVNSVVNDLTVLKSINVGNLLSIATGGLTFFRGIARIVLFDYSFYTGSWAYIRVVYVVVLGGGMVMEVVRSLQYVYGSFVAKL